jgi:NTE family protein
MKVGIVLSGGGAKGAFEVGALSVLLPYLKRHKHELVAISGTSIGAFNGAFVVANQFAELKEIWHSWDKNKCALTETGFLGPVFSFATKGYAFRTPYKFLKENLNIEQMMSSRIKYINTAVRLGDGEMYIGGNTKPKSDDLALREILASMAPSPVTPSVTINGEEYVDGGFRDTVPTRALVEHCGETLDRVYVISVNPKDRIWNPALLANDTSSLFERVSFAFNDILWDEALRNDLEWGQQYFPKDGSYVVVYPEVAHTTGANFSKARIGAAYSHGIEVMQGMLRS